MRKNAELMVLLRDVAARRRRSTTSSLATVDAGRGQAAVRLPRVPHAVRSARRGVRRRRAAAIAPSGRRVEVTTPSVARSTIRPRRSPARSPAVEALDLAGAWSGEPGGATLLGLAFVTDPIVVEVAWMPAPLLADESLDASALAADADRARPRRQGDHARAARRGIDLRSSPLDTAIAAYLIDPAEARYALERPDHDAHAVRRRPSDRRRRRPARPRRQAVSEARARRRRDALAVRHIAEPIEAALARSGTGRPLRRRSRTRSCACWPGWSMSASASTRQSCATQRPTDAEATRWPQS